MSEDPERVGWWAARRARRGVRRAAEADVEPVVVAIFHTEVEARLAAGHLRGAGIPAMVTLDQPEGRASWVEAARVLVPRRRREEATALLAEIDEGGSPS